MDQYSYCLYIKHNDVNCTDMLVPENTAIIDVDLLTERPGWLRGIPTVVKLSDGSLYEGINAIQKLKSEFQRREHHTAPSLETHTAPIIENNKIQPIKEESIPKTTETDIQKFLDARKHQDKRLGFVENQ